MEPVGSPLPCRLSRHLPQSPVLLRTGRRDPHRKRLACFYLPNGVPMPRQDDPVYRGLVLVSTWRGKGFHAQQMSRSAGTAARRVDGVFWFVAPGGTHHPRPFQCRPVPHGRRHGWAGRLQELDFARSGLRGPCRRTDPHLVTRHVDRWRRGNAPGLPDDVVRSQRTADPGREQAETHLRQAVRET